MTGGGQSAVEEGSGAGRGIRRPLIAVAALLVLVLAEAALDPTGLLVLVGWPGGEVQIALGWPIARYAVFAPVLFGAVWWAARCVGDRFWPMVLAIVWAVTLAQAVTLLAMTGDVSLAAWGAGYVLAKAVPAALIVALVTRFGGRRPQPRSAVVAPLRGVVLWAVLLSVTAVAVLPGGRWWSAPVTADAVPVPLIGRPLPLLLIGTALWLLCGWAGMSLMTRRVPSAVLGAWLGTTLGGVFFGVVASVIAVVQDGIGSDLWPGASTGFRIADGVSLGVASGVVAAALAVPAAALAHRTRPAARRVRALAAVAGAAALLLVLALVPGQAAPTRPAAQPPAGFLRVDQGRITDGAGDQVLLRGVNVNQLVDFYAYDPAQPVTTSFTRDDVQRIAAYGFTVIRLGLSWSALEPTRGALDPEYLRRIDDVVGWAKEAGIRVVLDMHQDGWWNGASPADVQCRPGTEPMWGYDGAPEWATITDGAPRCQFQGRDISPAGDRAFEHFFFNTEGVRSALARTWGELAGRYRADPTVAGFDLLNEPGFGETAPATTSLLLGAFYDDAIREIRAAGAPQIVFVEPSILWSGLGVDAGPRTGFTQDRNVVFSPHLYAESITMDRDLGIPPIVAIERQFALAQRVAAAHGTALWSGEYGYWGDDLIPRLDRYAAAEDAHVLGSAYWVWKQACGDPQNGRQKTGDGLIPQDCATGGWLPPKSDILTVLSRPYPRVAPGRITTLSASPTRVDVAGSASSRSCGLDIWFPGTTRPGVTAHGVQELRIEQRDGGWAIRGCADGDYAVQARR